MNTMTDSPEDLVERVAVAIAECSMEGPFEDWSVAIAKAAIAAFPDLSVLQGFVGKVAATMKCAEGLEREADADATLDAIIEDARQLRDAPLRQVLSEALSPLPDLEGEDQTVSQSQPISDGLRPTTSGSEPSAGES